MQYTKAKNIDEYIASFPEPQKGKLKQIRKLVAEFAPDAEETISYQMPTFKLNGKNLLHFAAFDHHIGFYPIPSGIEAFKKELSGYKQGKGSVQFPLDKPLPLEVIGRIVEFRVKENIEKAKKK
jgi:uncharacterized protein YdhG (YjbR/CyaY superfamily)